MKENFNKEQENQKLPAKSGWYWVLIDGYGKPTPCWYTSEIECFLPGGMGDSSSMGLYKDDIEKVGPEIGVPIF